MRNLWSSLVNRLCLLALVMLAVASGWTGATLLNRGEAHVGSPPASANVSVQPTAAAATLRAVATPIAPYPAGSIGYAISFPQCGASLPGATFEFAVVGVTGGRAFTPNPCLAGEYQWARLGRRYVAFYMNTNFDEAAYPDVEARLKVMCRAKGASCEAYLYGYAAAEDAFATSTRSHAAASMWWLDVQIASTWSDDLKLNALVIRGAVDALRSHDVRVGISSTPYQWKQVAGDYAPGLPGWVAGAADVHEAAAFCDGREDFGGGHTEQIAYVADGFEMVRACGPAASSAATRASRGLGD